MTIKASVRGIPDFKRELLDLPEKLRRRPVRNALAAGARVVRDEAKRNAPVLDSSAAAVRRGVRKPGTVKDAIKVRTSKDARRAGNVGVYVNVKPVRGGGRNNPNDPFYWRWLNYGWNPGKRGESKARRRALARAGAPKRRPGSRFLEAAAARLNDALQIFNDKMLPEIAKLNAKLRGK